VEAQVSALAGAGEGRRAPPGEGDDNVHNEARGRRRQVQCASGEDCAGKHASGSGSRGAGSERRAEKRAV